MDPKIVEAALAAARERDQPVAEVPLVVIAKAAGMSRSTLIRRIRHRAALDQACREAGVDPGSRVPVRDRAVAATAHLVTRHGLGAFTLEAVADAARCAVPSLYAVFGSRDGLLAAVFDHYGPVPDLRQLAADPPADVEETVRRVYRALTAVFTREPRVMPALFADLLARPDGPASRLVHATLPSMIVPLDALLSPHVRAGRLRPLPLPLLVQLLIGPLLAHLLTRSALRAVLPADVPGFDDVCDTFTAAFLRAAAP
ncbi:TetR/AcrR family transcriptional regulator [Saccharothrix hoggarensis]|uniref:TetR/AcrR family transcriptional regulator n=1 Tax=Saccharothrix hoggarensis TaxID=913853 RepID=A0ABW3QSA3_9PSEU